MCFGVGMAGDSIADYYFDIPKYEKIAKNVSAHFIVFTSIEDILPDQPTDGKRGLFKAEPLRLVHDHWAPSFQNEKRMLNKLGLYFVWTPFHRFISNIKTLDFMPKIQRTDDEKIKSDSKNNASLSASWHFLLSELKKQTDKPIVFIYCPQIPKIEGSEIIYKDDNHKYISDFTKIAATYGITVLNAASEFNKFYNKTGLFPRGFDNSRPGDGHFNKHGHEIVSRLISDYILVNIAK
jgi:hypothetical protein